MYTLQEHIDKAERLLRAQFADGDYKTRPAWIGEAANGTIVPVIGFQPDTIEDLTHMLNAARAAFRGFNVVQYVSIMPGLALKRGELRPAISIAAFDMHGNSKAAVIYVLKNDHDGKLSLSPIEMIGAIEGPGADLLKTQDAPTQSATRH